MATVFEATTFRGNQVLTEVNVAVEEDVSVVIYRVVDGHINKIEISLNIVDTTAKINQKLSLSI